MGHFDPGPLPKEISMRWMQKIISRLKSAINYMDETNFKSGLDGNVIKSGTLSVTMKELEWAEIPVPLVLPTQAVTTTATTGAPLGGYFLWNPSAYRGGDWYFEVSLATTAGTATATLTGVADIGTVTTTESTLTLVRSGKLTMPVSSQNVWVKLSVDNSANTASLAGARLIFVPS